MNRNTFISEVIFPKTLDSMKLDELRLLARRNKIKYYNKKTKQQLIELLREKIKEELDKLEISGEEFNKKKLDSMKKADLLLLARKNKIKYYSKKTKQQLIELLREKIKEELDKFEISGEEFNSDEEVNKSSISFEIDIDIDIPRFLIFSLSIVFGSLVIFNTLVTLCQLTF